MQHIKNKISIIRYLFCMMLSVCCAYNSITAQELSTIKTLKLTDKQQLEDYGLPKKLIDSVRLLNASEIQHLNCSYAVKARGKTIIIKIMFIDDCIVGYLPKNSTGREELTNLFVVPVEWVCTTHETHTEQHTALLSELKLLEEDKGCKGWHQKQAIQKQTRQKKNQSGNSVNGLEKSI